MAVWTKKKVAAIIFATDASRRALEDFLHPLVFEKITRLLRQTDSGSGIVVVETPLLFERQYEGEFQRIITVRTKQESALDRLQTKGVLREDALQRMQKQLPIEDKASKSDFIVNNDGTREETELQVKNIYKKLLREGRHGDRRRSRSLKKTLH